MLEFGQVSGRARLHDADSSAPLIVAVHGGTYDSAYFDVPGHSLLDRAVADHLPIIAIDRAGYGDTPLLAKSAMTLRGQGQFLVGALGDIWRLHGEGRPGLFVIGHSIGAAISLFAASNPGDLPLLGLAVSGVGMRTPSEHKAMWESFPDEDLVGLPDEVKDGVMFGPEGSYDPQAPAAARIANRTVPRVEIVDIVSNWAGDAENVLGAIRVPVHYRQGEFDRLWLVDEDEVKLFEKALSQSPLVDAAMATGMGHCLDFHTIGAAFQREQLRFAVRCGEVS
ncbi:alpha/beta hydrolase [Sphingomonas sp.]|uniref:alpha/beta fold hydrolase n=1 Tax=Sphingomonas sp. TaxID=28214 RepID=UPI0025EDF827|nr:alpha/beta hydrolase [Sphingomonas sp.]